MKLSQLVMNDMYLPLEWDREFDHISTDSRTIKKGDLFVALPGVKEHGEKFIHAALANGAVAVLVAGDMAFRCEKSEHYSSVPVFYAPEVSQYFASWVRNRYSIHGMHLFAVTGTNGKSSVTQFIAQLADLCNEPCGLFGTLGNGRWPNLKATQNTTSDLITLVKELSAIHADGVNLAALEVSSHGLVQKRVEGLAFDTAVMTNLSQDHLDYHGSMEEYYAAKKQLFTSYHLENALINIDDQYGRTLATDGTVSANVYTYGMSEDAQIRCTLLDYNPQGMHAELKTPWGIAELTLPLMGEFNLVNVAAAISVLSLQGMEFQTLCEKAKYLRPVSGRMEVYVKENAPVVVIDFAHTPDALRNVLRALQPWQREITTVFGCGGDRDRTKRPLMCDVACELSAQVWLTDDNPRTENPEQIFNDVLNGRAGVHTEHDRKRAISQALQAGGANSIVLIAGKGHEAYQDINGVKLPYNDGEFVQELGYQRLGGGND